MPNILIIGATRGLGAALANLYASHPDTTVFGTTRSSTAPTNLDSRIVWVTEVDVSKEDVGTSLVGKLGGLGQSGEGGGAEGGKVGLEFGVVIITAGYFATEDFEFGPKWAEEVKMYTTSSISPPFIIHSLHTAQHLPPGSKIILISSESGSLTLRHAREGGGNYAHHASKAALNMVGRLLALDLRASGVVVSIVHPGFMRTEMTRGVGFDRFWEEGGAVGPDVAAGSLVGWVEGVGMERTGQFWAPRGAADIGTAEVTIGKDLPTPLELPW